MTSARGPAARTRLRDGEILAGIAAVALLVMLFVLHWLTNPETTGWNALPVIRWLLLLTGVVAIALTVTQAMLRGPAVPVSLSVFVTVLGVISTIVLLVRVATTSRDVTYGLWLGLLATIALPVGGFRSMRAEQGWTPDADHPVEVVPLTSGPLA